MNTHEIRLLYPPSHLFTVRLWIEEFGDGQREVRMQVKHVLSGETHYFRDWALLMAYLRAKMQENDFESSTNNQ